MIISKTASISQYKKSIAVTSLYAGVYNQYGFTSMNLCRYLQVKIISLENMKMINIIIKHFFIYLCCTYMYHTILSYSKYNHAIMRLYFLSAICIISATVMTYILRLTIPSTSYIITLLFLWIVYSPFPRRPLVALYALMISFCVSYCLFTFSSILALSIQHLVFHTAKYTISIIISGILSILSIFLLHRIKRLKSGMIFLYSQKSMTFGTVISVLFLASLTYIHLPNDFTHIAKLLTIFLFLLSMLSIIFWWVSRLNQHYISCLKSLELASLKSELAEQTNTINMLRAKNEDLGRLLHRDNKLIPALENAVQELLNSQLQNHTCDFSKCEAILSELKHFSFTRQNCLNKISAEEASYSFQTGVPALDIFLTYTKKRALRHDISFSAVISRKLTTLVPAAISSDNLIHLLANLIDNAIIATFYSSKKEMLLQIYDSQGIGVIELSDTGISFEKNTLLNLGLVPSSTHIDVGGNGIGLLDIWNIRNQYLASLYITEYKDPAPFSKKIAFAFDRKLQYLIYTYRAEEILHESKRLDLLVLPPNESDITS